MTHPSTFPLRLPLLLCALVLCTIPRSASAAISSYDDVRGRPYTVGWDHRALLINNQRVLLLSGGIHYPRSTPAMWPHLMRELRASGLNAMQSYLFWSYHEVQPGVWDLSSESRNVTAFLDAARDAGVWVNLRMGPYVCGEWSYGGIPVWLRSDFAFRDANAQWLAAMSSFYAHMLPVLEPYLARNGGPIILTQVENEIGIFESTPPSRRQQAYVDWCGAYASALMTDTVITLPHTCTRCHRCCPPCSPLTPLWSTLLSAGVEHVQSGHHPSMHVRVSMTVTAQLALSRRVGELTFGWWYG